jgi:hypothetical protein
VAQYRTAAVGASGVPSVAKKAGNEYPVLALSDLRVSGQRCPFAVSERTLSLPFADFRKLTQSGHRAKHRAEHTHFSLAARHPTTEVARADAKLEKLQQLSRRPRTSFQKQKLAL